jgi:hypothetical protein
MRPSLRRALLLLFLSPLAGCRDGDGTNAVNADALVVDLIQNQTNETGAPVAVNGLDLVFSADPAVLATVLPLDAGPVVER